MDTRIVVCRRKRNELCLNLSVYNKLSAIYLIFPFSYTITFFILYAIHNRILRCIRRLEQLVRCDDVCRVKAWMVDKDMTGCVGVYVAREEKSCIISILEANILNIWHEAFFIMQTSDVELCIWKTYGWIMAKGKCGIAAWCTHIYSSDLFSIRVDKSWFIRIIQLRKRFFGRKSYFCQIYFSSFCDIFFLFGYC